jgi:transposase InsO family protein
VHDFGEVLGFIMRNAPNYTPRATAFRKLFLKTLKRDYIYLNELNSAAYLISQLDAWFEDYNENTLHKTLKMNSPRIHAGNLIN